MPLLAALPLLAVLGLMLGARWSAARAGAIGLVLAIVLALTQFELAAAPGGPAGATIGALAEALFTAATILWIILPALAIHRLQLASGAVAQLRAAMASLSSDPRLAALLVAWFFALLLEGAAGFGTAAALAAPFLVTLGLSPLRAVAAALIGHAVGVAFGAVGTPIIVQAATTGEAPAALAPVTALYSALLGWVMIGALAVMLARAGDSRAKRLAIDRRFALWCLAAGLLFLLPFVAIASWLGPELPTLGGATFGAVAFVGLMRLGGRATQPETVGSTVGPAAALRSAAPYVVLVALVIVTRLLPPLRDTLQAIEWQWTLVEGAYGGSLQPLFHPGTMLALALVVGATWQGATRRQVAVAVARTVRQIGTVAVALMVMLGLARVMLHGGLIDSLAVAAADALGGWWPMVSPLVGALGTFVTGSATASNALFSSLQAATADSAGLARLEILGAQGVGAALGNAIAPHNMIAAAAVVGVAGKEAEILRRTVPATLVALLLAGGLAMILSGLS